MRVSGLGFQYLWGIWACYMGEGEEEIAACIYEKVESRKKIWMC